MNIPVLLTSHTNIYYMTGFTSSNAAVILEGNALTILTDFRYEQAAQQTGFSVVLLEQGKKLYQGILEHLQASGHDKVYFEAQDMRAELFLKLVSRLELIPIDEEFNKVRCKKEKKELACMQRAADIAVLALEQVKASLVPGVCEQEIAAKLDYQMRKRGAEAPSFETIVAFGANASLPHHIPGESKLRRGDCVLVDMGARVQGYCSDMTRTWFCGEAPLSQVYGVVLEAQQKALDALRPGVSGREIDAIAREHITQQGYGEHFGHGLGHGVGIDIHEIPFLNQTGEQVLEENMVVTIEPGIYLPGRGGVRIEDMCVITPGGHRNMTKMSKELTIL